MRSHSRYSIPLVVLLVLLLVAFVAAACGDEGTTTTTGGTDTTAPASTETTATTAAQQPPEQDKIVIGAARPVSGPLAFFEENAYGPIYRMWVDEVNAAGGIDVAGKKLPIELKIYDDQSNLDTSMRLLTKLMEEDKVDFVLGPTSTAFLFAAAGVANAHEYILMSTEGGATSLEKEMENLPYYFQVLSYSNHYQMPVLAEIFAEVGAKSAAILYIDDLHGIEYQEEAEKELTAKGVEIVMKTAIPADVKDLSTIIKQVEGLNPDALLCFAYPDQNFLLQGQLMQLNYNPKMLLLGPGGNYQFYYNAFGPATEGVIGEGAWNAKSSAAAKEFYDKLVAYLGTDENLDWWGAILNWAELQFFQQAIEKAGTLDQKVIRDIMATEHFETVLGDTFYTNNILDKSCYPGQIGQWQNGIFEVIDPGDKRTAPPIYPKPAWPAPTETTAAP